MTKWMVLPCSVQQGQSAGDARELECGSGSGVAKAARAAGFRLHSRRKHISCTARRSYSLSRRASRPGLAAEAGRTSACSVIGFSSKHTTGSAGLYGRSYVSSTSSILAMYSSLSSPTHHIVFPPRLEVVVEEQDANGLPSHARN